ncbi:MAG: carbamoyltransferase [Candidatus Omnitrophota bacterium]|nr:carbamoyltransferase [Candidatus Omnitrophota bacterium]
MAVYILGISCFYHDAAAALIKDGEIIAAAQEERFTRKKHDFNFPENAIKYCLSEACIETRDLSFVAFYDKPLLKFERILLTYFSYAPIGFRSFNKAIPLWLRDRLWMSSLISENLNYQGKILFTEHHESHASSAFYPSPFKEAAILTMDGVGEWATTSFGVGKDNDFELLYEIRFPHSLGLLYSAFTYYTGFKVNSAEYKVMGLAPYGEPKYANLILKELIDLKEDGSFKLNMKYFNYCAGLTMTNKNFDKLFKRPPRKPETKITQLDMDLARSVQAVTEEAMLRTCRHIHKLTGQKNLCLAGGVALNCVANGKILKEGPFENIWIQPSAGDAGGALGAALRIWYKYLGNKRSADDIHDSQKGSYLGPEYQDSYIENYLKTNNIAYSKLGRQELSKTIAGYISNEKVIGWFQGRMEFGPRALGARSIIGDARSPVMQSRMNLKIKFRESFRPFAPSVLAEKAKDYFNIDCESPYMLLVAEVEKSHICFPIADRKTISDRRSEKELEGFDRLKIIRSDIPAVTHIDNSARLQTVSEDTPNKAYYELIMELYKNIGCPVIINTSFNVRGEPIVASPQDAYRCFMRTEMDYLVIGSFVIDRKQQPKKDLEDRQYFELD